MKTVIRILFVCLSFLFAESILAQGKSQAKGKGKDKTEQAQKEKNNQKEDKDKEDVDDIQVQAELYKGIKKHHVIREKTNTDERNGVYVYQLTNEGKEYLQKEVAVA